MARPIVEKETKRNVIAHVAKKPAECNRSIEVILAFLQVQQSVKLPRNTKTFNMESRDFYVSQVNKYSGASIDR